MKEEFQNFLNNIDKSNVHEKMLKIPSMVFDHGYHVEKLSYKLDIKQNELDEISASVSIMKREKAERMGIKAPSETSIKDHVTFHKDVKAIKKEIADIKFQLKQAKLYIETLKSAREMLPNAAHNYREERRSTEFKRRN